MTTPTSVHCSACGFEIALRDALEITRVRDGATTYLHRPSVNEGCFRFIGTRDVSRLRLASPEERARRFGGGTAA
jgi:hypothetical protein